MHFWSQRLPYLREFSRDHRVLHMGPGRDESYGITADILRSVRPNVLVDLNRAPYPFKDNSFDAVYAFSVVEHLDNFFGVFGELWRILKPGGFVVLLTPHFSNDGSYIDPSHRLHLSLRSWDYFIEGTELFREYGFYSETRFRVREKLLMISPPWSRVPLLQRAVNRLPVAYERHLCYLIRGAGIYLELEAVKPQRT
jgi:SAM-dependent methyltransferase